MVEWRQWAMGPPLWVSSVGTGTKGPFEPVATRPQQRQQQQHHQHAPNIHKMQMPSMRSECMRMRMRVRNAKHEIHKPPSNFISATR